MNISNFNLLNFRNNKEVSTYHSKEFFNSYSLKINSLDYTIAKIVALIVTAPFAIGAITFIGAYDITSKSIALIKNKIYHNKPKTPESSKMLKVALAAAFITSIAIGTYMYANTGVVEKSFRENFKERVFKSLADRSAESCQSNGLLKAIQGELNPVIELPSSGETTFERVVSNSTNLCQSEMASKVIQGRPSNSSLIMSRLSKAIVSLTNNRTETYQSIPSFTDMNLPSIFTTKSNVGLKPPYIMHYSAAAVVTAAKEAYKGLEYGFYGLKTTAVGAYDFSIYMGGFLLDLSERVIEISVIAFRGGSPVVLAGADLVYNAAYKGLEYGFYGLKTAAIGAYDFSIYMSRVLSGFPIEKVAEITKLFSGVYKKACMIYLIVMLKNSALFRS